MEKTALGIELGSTRIKAVTIDGSFKPVSSRDYTWASSYKNGIWTYSLDEVWTGLKSAITKVENRADIAAAGVSAMMHGYLAFDADWNLLTPFRTWQNTITGPAAAELTGLFDFNIPQRWSIAHLYQAVLNGEEHVARIAHLTTLAGYIHYKLTGVNAMGIGEASGMFPIDSAVLDYDQAMVEKFDNLPAIQKLPWKLRNLLPKVLTAGEPAGALTESGAALLGGLLPVGISARVTDMATIKPPDEAAVLSAAKDCGKIVTCEEHSIFGGLGEVVCAVIVEHGIACPVKRVGVNDEFGHSGPAGELLKQFGLCATNLAKAASEA